MKNLLTLLSLCIAAAAQAQLRITPGAALTITGGTALISDSLVIQPASTLSLTDLSITRTNNFVTGMGGSSVSHVYVLSQDITTDGAIGFWYTDAELNGNTPASLQLAYNNGAGWITTGTSVSNTAARYISNTFSSPTVFSKITAVNNAITLPVHLISFDAQPDESRTRLSWELADPGDISYCSVQRSADGQAFSSTGRVDATAMPGYIFYDNQPLDGLSYYRLRIWGKDGSVVLSAVRPVLFSRKGAQQMIAWPLPAKDALHVALAAEPGANAAISISDLTGKVLLTQPCTSRSQALDMAALAAGMYLLRYEDGGTVIALKFERL